MRLRTRWAAAAVLLLTFLGLGPAPAQAAGLQEVTGFGPNPGNLTMRAYVPDGLPAGAPLVVALHGCTQDATGYFGNSGWRELADRGRFALVLPEQRTANNLQKCFQWFEAADSARGQGEAASIRQMTAHAQQAYGTDPARTYVTGLSAGGGMTANLLAAYPDVYAAGAVNAGLPARCASTLLQASSCQFATTGRTPAQWGDLVRGAYPGHDGPWPRVTVWQGTADYTVYPANADALRDQWTDVWGISATPSRTEDLPGGTTRAVYDAPSGGPAVDVYTIPGMGHGLAVDPGSGPEQCGATGAYYLDAVCSGYYTARSWGLL